jgi:hypothetical protein
MSTSAAGAARRLAARTVPAAPRLRLVAPPASARGRTPFVGLVIALLSLGLTGLIVLSTVLQRQAFELQELDRTASRLETRHNALSAEVAESRSPGRLAAEAVRLGMVPNTNPVFLRLSDGEVVGKPRPAEKGTNVKRVDR